MRTEIKTVMFLFLVFVSNSFSVVDYYQPLTPDSETIALWHMDAIVDSNGNGTGTDKWVASDPVNTTNELRLIGLGATPVGQIVTGPTNTNAIALSQGNNPWERFDTRNPIWHTNYDTVKVELWFNYNNILGSTRNIAETDTAWILQKWANSTVAQLGFIVRFSDGSNGQVWLEQPEISNFSNKWVHLTALFDKNGQMSLNAFTQDGSFNQTVTADYAGKSILDSGDETIYAGYGRQVMAFDDMRVSVPGCPGGLLAADFNKDCYINFKDFAQFASQWLNSTQPQF